MSLNQDQIDRVQTSFRNLQESMAPTATMFYDNLFRRAPEYRELFRDDLEGQGMRFMTTLALVVNDLQSPEQLEDRISELGRSHAVLGITPSHFQPMEEALMDTMRVELGDGFDAQTEAAWRAAYGELAAAIIAKGNIA